MIRFRPALVDRLEGVLLVSGGMRGKSRNGMVGWGCWKGWVR